MSPEARPLRVLIVDDNPAIHDDFTKILRPHAGAAPALAELEAMVFEEPTLPAGPTLEVELSFAHQGEEALAMVCEAARQGRPFAVAFVDVRMPPGIDGIETIARLWTVDPDVQAVVCTAYSDHSWEDMTRVLGQGDRFLVLKKPFDPIEVLQLAHALTRKWTLAREVAGQVGRLERIVAERTAALERMNLELAREVEAKRVAQSDLERLAAHDVLTGLPNRLLLDDRLNAALLRARRRPSQIALLLIDLDDFKEVNDTYGHAAGDEVLRQTARRLERAVRACDTVARMGGDEFVVLLGDLASPEDAAVVAARIVELCSEPVMVAGRQMKTSPSVGIALSPDDGGDAETMLQCADLAMYQAKAEGRACYRFFNQNMLAGSLERMRLREELGKAIERGELELWYQPLVDLRRGTMRGMEALLRWIHPQRGIVAPNTFIPEAERSGLIVPIGAWVLQTACHQLAAWLRAGGQLTTIAVNVSARQLQAKGFVETVRQALITSGLEPHCLELEITESTAFDDVEEARSVLARIADLGVRILIDDFGSGFSSLDRLKSLPIDGLKIDRFFIKNVATDPRDAAIVMAIVSMAHALGIEVVAEGIETQEQLDALRELRWPEVSRPVCDRGQGYFLGRPVPAAQAERVIFRRASTQLPAVSAAAVRAAAGGVS